MAVALRTRKYGRTCSYPTTTVVTAPRLLFVFLLLVTRNHTTTNNSVTMILEGVHGFTLDTHVQATFCHEISVPILTLPSTIAADDDDRINATAITTAAATAGADANANTEDTRLTTYMRLPVEQYVCVPMPLKSKLSRYINTATSSLSEDDDIVSAAANNTTNTTTSHPPTTNDFELIVPPVKFLWLEVQPIIKARVVLEPDRVLIQSHEATLIGSSFISTSKLNERFDFCARAELTWSDGEMDADTDNTEADPGSFVSASSSSSSSSSKEDEEDEDEIGERVIINHKQKSDSSMTSEGEDEEREQNEYNNNSNTKTTRTTNTPTTSTIYATTSIAVNVDVPNPFRTVVPHRVLVKTGNTAVQLSLQFMIRSFLAGLVTDYKRWVQDAEYRRYRAELSETASSSPSNSQPHQPNTEETINYDQII